MPKSYTKEEKERAVRIAKEDGVKAAERITGISHQNISRWKAEAEERGEVPSRGQGRPSYPAIIEEQRAVIEKLQVENNYLEKQNRRWKALYEALVRRFVNDE